MKKLVMLTCCLFLFASPLCAQEAASDTETPTQKAGGVKSLEKRVRQLEEAIGREVPSTPVLHLAQMLGLAVGLTPKQLGLNRNLVPVVPVANRN